jgi:stage II sporulation protein D
VLLHGLLTTWYLTPQARSKMRKLKKRIKFYLVPLLTFAGFTSFFVPAESIQIRVFAHLKITDLHTIINLGTYKLVADGNVIADCRPLMDFNVSAIGDSIELKQNEKPLGIFKYIKFVSDSGCELKLKISYPDRKVRTYLDDLSFSVSEGFLKIINEVALDNYIAGVTEAEAGSKSSLEFYKVQAILARTFALAHINKHLLEGYSLCDQVHCQAYYGKPRDANIYKAMEGIRGKVVVDENLNLIIAAFHSNSGGQTANSEDVWGSHTSYLRSVADSFSTKMPNSKWERRMLKDDWLSYLKLKHNFPVENEEEKKAALNFKQDTRKIYLECNNSRVPLKNIRLDLQLKSTFFSISQINKDSVLFMGRGYGHGLGMCQEGAMRMARLGYSYLDILNFYYQDIQLIDLHKLNFFKDE